MLVPITALGFFLKGHGVLSLIVCVTLYTSFNAFALPAWQSLMSDYLPHKKRGRYFGWRNKVLGTVTIACLLGAGVILQFFRQNPLRGFVLIFSAAALCRFACVYFLCRMYEQKHASRADAYFSFLEFVRRAPESNYAKFVFFVSAFTFSVYLASPFFSVFMLKDLKFDYLTYTVLVTTVSAATILTIDRWGRTADRIGNIKVLRVTAFFIASLPFCWIFNQHPVYLFFAQALSGIAWAGFNLCALNFIYDAVTPAKRTRCIAYFSACNGTAVFLGSFAGGFLASRLPIVFGWRLLTLFFISGLLRFFIALSLPARIREVRAIEPISTKDLLLRIIGLKSVAE